MRSVARPYFVVLWLLLVLFSSPSAAQVWPPPWTLYQTDPNPFCREIHGSVVFQIDMPQAATLNIRVLDPAHAEVVCDVITTSVPAGGRLRVTWNVRNNSGAALADGIYFYELGATDGPGGIVLYEETKTMSVTCEVGVEQGAWGAVKRLFK